MSKQLGLVAMLAATTIGCATQEGYEKILSSYVGASEASLLAQWGPPDQAYSSDASTKYLTYSKSRSGYVPGVPPTYQSSCSFGVCTTIPIGGLPGYSYTDTCKTSFKLVDGTIASWRFEGDACRA
jgi:hypothetical protein